MKGKVFKSIVLFVAIMLVFAGGANASGGNVTPIPPGPETSLPDYIGAPAKAHPLANSGVPQNPNLAPNPFMGGHTDTWMSDSADIAGPLGRNPVTLSTDLTGVHNKSWLTPGGSISHDSHGRVIVNAYGVNEASIVLLDPDTLEVLTYYPLVVEESGPLGEGAQKFLPSMWSIYGALDNRDRLHMVSGSRYLLTLEEIDTPSGPEFQEAEGGYYDLSELVTGGTVDPSDDDRISAAIMDFRGRYWINMGRSANIYVLDPATTEEPYTRDRVPHVDLGFGEFTRNGLALTRDAAYIVTTEAMYRVEVGADGWPYVVWREPYDTSWGRVPPDYKQEVRPGQYELGSGTTPTILGEGKYVAITDNAEQMQVVVFRTEEKLDPGEERIVCEVPVFDFPGGGSGANSNSLIGYRNSIIVQNTSDYLFDWGNWSVEPPLDAMLVTPGKPGIERIDINPNGKGCTKVWVNKEVSTNACPRLSTRTGLIYTMNRKHDLENNVDAYYWVALDFRTGEVVWEKFAGTGDRFDNWWAPTSIGPNGALYVPGYGGVMMIRDAP